jgi:hypothetical protein
MVVWQRSPFITIMYGRAEANLPSAQDTVVVLTMTYVLLERGYRIDLFSSAEYRISISGTVGRRVTWTLSNTQYFPSSIHLNEERT